jgi:hypothetical protein
MKGASTALFRAIVTMTETIEGRDPKTYAPQVFGPHETLSPVKAAVTRYQRSFNWRSAPYGERSDGSYGRLDVKYSFDVKYQTVTIEWKPVEA